MSMISATGVDIPPEEYFQRYILSSHGFLLRKGKFKIIYYRVCDFFCKRKGFVVALFI